MIQRNLIKQFLNASAACTGVFVCLASALAMPAYANQANELKGVKSEISRQQQQLKSSQSELNKLQAQLKKHELSISEIDQKIRQSEINLKKANNKLSQYQTKYGNLELVKQKQLESLEELVKSYYVSRKKYDAASLLQGTDKAELDRINHYIQHLAQMRSDTIAALSDTETQLDDTALALKQEREQIANLLASQKKQRSQLTQSQSGRKKTIAKINASIRKDKNYLSELQRNETRLKAEIEKAKKRNAVPMNGLAKQKGKLPWPLKGKVLHRYGSKQDGQLVWKGTVISATHRQPVKAVYSGTVVFAEYLRGYGLMVLIDHGKGDMTLYGYNHALTKKEGDKVTAGETIALAGDTGGQDRVSLYFEIRRNSEAQDPRRWLR
ncbi:peptidoglycan DD-metalloendopeptidase family protein [Vibrio sp. SCSIO 43136]|uniref:murein hydrolase activator EnvC family protein n=1 Tax=Vibrio sp. SCSIO 43136 TaxID=2819101 RepID=UPI00207607C6|nr:peptidoglycan DD-metalloendopeptidase family protein [Vibrio sp. SCSIO 43136]USD65101.1 peptidoglycan DD-metalloendopeptidase family protein [Vibrio sp. SCSIO 43136]